MDSFPKNRFFRRKCWICRIPRSHVESKCACFSENVELVEYAESEGSFTPPVSFQSTLMIRHAQHMQPFPQKEAHTKRTKIQHIQHVPWKNRFCLKSVSFLPLESIKIAKGVQGQNWCQATFHSVDTPFASFNFEAYGASCKYTGSQTITRMLFWSLDLEHLKS